MLDILNGTIDLGKKAADVFKTLKIKLTGDEAAASKNLNDVMDELIKFYIIIQEEISNFQSLDFANTGSLPNTKRVLYDIQSGAMGVRIEEARGSCNKIKRIYQNDLDTWFQRVFSSENDKYREVDSLFHHLFLHDVNMIQATEDLEKYLSQKSEAIMDLMNNTNSEVTDYHNASSNELLDTRKKLSLVVKHLVQLKNEFAQLRGAV